MKTLLSVRFYEQSCGVLNLVEDLPALDFLKCDTEGCELLVVKGAIQTIKRFRPVMVMEHNYKTEVDEVLKVLEGAGVPYNVTVINDPTMTNDDANTDYLYEPVNY